jgi:hypothetical protein
MGNRARSTVRGLAILGNSIRGIRFATWRRLFHAIVIPILTYGAAVWHPSTGSRPGLTLPLQTAQNDALRKMAGCFRTTPVDPLHSLLAIPPIVFTLRKIVRSYSDRVSRLPPSHCLHTILDNNPASHAWLPHEPPTTLRRILQDIPRVHFVPPSPPYDDTLTHPHLSDVPAHPLRPATHLITKRRMSRPNHAHLSLYIQSLRTDDQSSHTAWLVYDGPSLRQSGITSQPTHTASLLDAVATGLAVFASDTRSASCCTIYLPSRLPYPYLLRTSKHPYLPFSTRITVLLWTVLDTSRISVDLRWYSPSWAASKAVKSQADLLWALRPPAPTLTHTPDRKEEMYADWYANFTSSTHTQPYFLSCTPPDGNRPPPFVRGVLSRGSRHLFAAAIQITTGHAFMGTYSCRFRPHANDTIHCPCSQPGAPVIHSARHIILHCPRHSRLRHDIFGLYPSWHRILTTFLGGSQLAEFILYSQELLRPLTKIDPGHDPP